MGDTAVDEWKNAAATWAADQLQDGMVVGLGSGSTASFTVAAIGRRMKNGLRVTGVPTSEKTAAEARSLGIPLTTLGDYDTLDVTIDGADEVDPKTLHLIKGGGGNLLREKIVAASSQRLVIVVDETKIVDRLGSHAKLPVEVTQFGWQSTARRLASLGSTPTLRTAADGSPFLTDGANYILDCAFALIADARTLQAQLDGVVGVMEHGLFVGLTSRVVIGSRTGVRILDPTGSE